MLNIIQKNILKSIDSIIDSGYVNTPYVVYNLDVIGIIIDELRRQIPKNLNCRLYYAAKANSNKEIIDFLSDKVDGVDVASMQELEVVKKSFNRRNISINGPGFTRDDVNSLLKNGYNVDINYREFLSNMEKHYPIGLRITETDISGKSLSRFGINLCDRNLHDLLIGMNVTRIHLHFGEKDFSFLEKFDRLLGRLKELGMLGNLTEINLGGGLYQLFLSNRLGEFFKAIQNLYVKYGLEGQLDTIIEPGYLLVSLSAFMVVSPINVTQLKENQIITINTSIFCNTIWYTPKIITILNSLSSKRKNTQIFGNTCYEEDKFNTELMLPILNESSCLVLYPVGAYVKSNHSNLHSNNFMNEVYL